MINNDVYKEILESGLMIDHYLVLLNIKNNKPLHPNKRVQGFINLLTKKEYLLDGKLTEKAIDLLQDINSEEDVKVLTFTESVKKPELPIQAEVVDFKAWIVELHRSLQDELYSLTRQRQIRDKIDKKTYSFLPNVIDLEKAMFKVVRLYKLTDYKKIEATLINYIKRCASANCWFPLLQYYIIKNGASQMVTDIESGNDTPDDQDFKSSQKFI